MSSVVNGVTPAKRRPLPLRGHGKPRPEAAGDLSRNTLTKHRGIIDDLA